jgi:hypothetical protein
MSERIPPFNTEHLQAACKVLGDTSLGLTGPEIGYVLQDMKVVDVTPDMTKWKRLFNALAGVQNTHQVGNHLIMFINRAMNPVSYARNQQAFEWRRDELNVVLAFSGFYVREDGKVVHSTRESTLTGARARAGRMRAALEHRNAGRICETMHGRLATLNKYLRRPCAVVDSLPVSLAERT